MDKSEFLGLNLPSRDSTTDIADINAISDNFKTIDGAFLDLVEKQIPEFQTKENINLNFDDDSTNEEQYPSVPAVVNFTNRKIDPLKIINSASGNAIALKDSAKDKLKGLKLYGKTTQNGTPTPDAPIPLVSVGDSGSFEVGVYSRNILDITIGNLNWNSIPITNNGNNSVTLNGTSNANWTKYILGTAYLPKGKYKIMNYGNANLGCYIEISDENDTGKLHFSGYTNGEPQIFEMKKSKKVDFLLIVPPNTTITNVTLSPMCMSADITDDTYEPCNKQTLTMPYTLRGKYNITDYIDFSSGKFVKNTDIYTISKTFERSFDSETPEYISFLVGGQPTNVKAYSYAILSNCFELDGTTSRVEFSYGTTWLRIPKSSGLTTKEQCLEWMNNNDIVVLYQYETPIETPLTETELNAYRQLYTYKGNTTILSEADMEISYVADPKLYIDNKIAELTALTLEG